MNVALIGYRGTGKSAVARILAEIAGMSLVNLDAAIVERAGMSIPQIVKESGWERFRDLESEVLEEAAAGQDLVLDCGGGIILREKNRELLKKSGLAVWLTAEVPTIIGRIAADDQRPSLTGKSFTDEVEEVLAARTPLYRETAVHVVPTDHDSPSKIAQKILRLIKG